MNNRQVTTYIATRLLSRQIPILLVWSWRSSSPCLHGLRFEVNLLALGKYLIKRCNVKVRSFSSFFSFLLLSSQTSHPLSSPSLSCPVTFHTHPPSLSPSSLSSIPLTHLTLPLSPPLPLAAQNLVTQMWLSVYPEEKLELRHFLMQHVVSRHVSLPAFLCKKIIRVIVLMGRADWPHQYPEFIDHIQQVGKWGLVRDGRQKGNRGGDGGNSVRDGGWEEEMME